MNVAAIIAEYNPLHEGHMYHIRKTREILGENTCIIAVMSGHVVQRGDFPILTKYARTEMALRAGIDLVFELPCNYAMAGAEVFARGAVAVLTQLGLVTHLSFGSECGDIEILKDAARLVPKAYPKDMSLANAWPEMYPEKAHVFTPNNILGIEYIRAIQGTGIAPVTIARSGSAHDDDTSSASAIRKRIFAGETVDIPFRDILERELQSGRAPISAKTLEPAIISYLRRLSPQDFAKVPDTVGGLSQRIYHAAQTATGLEELFQAVKTKRYTLSRVRRTVMHAFLRIENENNDDLPHVRLLGIGRNGRELLHNIKCEIISKPASSKPLLLQEAAITDQLCLAMPKPLNAGLEWTSSVILLRA